MDAEPSVPTNGVPPNGGAPGEVPPNALDRAMVAELLGYAGAAIALTADGLVFTNSSSLSKGTAAVALGLAAAGLVGAGALVGRSSDDRATRLRSVLWFLSVQAFLELLLILFVLDSASGLRAKVAVSAFLTTGYAGALWWISRRSLQQIGLFVAGVGTLLTLLFPDFAGTPDFTLLMLVTLVAGIGWFVLGLRGIVEPRRTAMVIGSVAALFSSLFLSVSGEAVASGLLLTIVGAVLVVVGHLVTDRAVSGLGIVGLLLGASNFVRASVEASDTGAIAALVMGLIVLAGAISLLEPRAPVAPETGPETPHPPPARDADPPAD